jgi:4-amino-4-deoxychorismate lyase
MLDCLINGEISRYLDVSDRGFNYGDGVFETIAVINGIPRYWQDHMDRLAVACDRLGFTCPPQAVLLREAQTVSAGKSRCIVKILLTRAAGERGYRPLMGSEPGRVVSSHAWPEGIEQAMSRGVEARICNLRLGLQPALGGMKHLNRLEQVLAAGELALHAEEEGILLDSEDHVISAISANLFLVFKEQLLTPRLDQCGVRGVLRARILKAFKSRCELRRVSTEMLTGASEVFLCSAIRGIVPVLRVDETQYTHGPVTRELQLWLHEVYGPS